MIRTYQYKLYDNKKNQKLINQIQIASQIYNYCISMYRIYFKTTGKHLHKFRLQKYLTLKKKVFKHWNQVPSQSIQDIVGRIDKGYKKFFDDRKRGVKASIPSFKSYKRYKSITLYQTGYKILENNKIRIGGVIYKYFDDRKYEGVIKTVTIKRDSLGDIYIYLACEIDSCGDGRIDKQSKEIGIDFGLKTFLTTSNGDRIESPLFFNQNSKELKRKSRLVSSKKKGSHNRERAKQDLFRQHRQTVNQRRDWFWKLAKSLAETHTAICIEDLNLKGMQRLWGRKINDLAFGEFVKILEMQCQKYHCKLIKIDRYYPSSQICSACGYRNDETKDLKIREWVCPVCQTKHDRDINASKNILRQGLSISR